MKRLVIFLRSVIPADPYQLVLLFGVVFLFVSPRLPWWPSEILEPSDLFSSALPDGNNRLESGRFIAAWLYPITFAGLAGYFACFWPGKTPVRRVLWAVCFPTTLSLVLILYKYFRLTPTTLSIFELHSSRIVFKWIQLNAWKLSPGFYFCAVGLLLVLVYTIRLAIGVSSLPVSMPKEDSQGGEDADSWPQVRLLVFVLVGPILFISSLLSFLLFGLPYISSLTITPTFLSVFARLAPVLDAALLVGIAVCILGKQGRHAARTSLHLPEPRNALLGLILAITVSGLIPCVNYLVDRAHWAAHDFGRFAPPQFSTYFDLTKAWQPWLLLMAFGALAEEIVFRGLLLPNFLGRYRLHRGIFLIGVVWTAIHLRSDSYSGLSVSGVLLHLANRVFLCMALNFVFAWMTLRWNSIIPAAVAHGTWNILVSMQSDNRELWHRELSFALWAILAYALFRFWPIIREETVSRSHSQANPEPVS